MSLITVVLFLQQITESIHTVCVCVYVCVCVCVFIPRSRPCGAPVGGRHWEISAWLGWTGPSAGLTAILQTPAEKHTWHQDLFHSNVAVIKTL